MKKEPYQILIVALVVLKGSSIIDLTAETSKRYP